MSQVDSTMLTPAGGMSWLPGTVLFPWLLAAGALLTVLLLVLDKRRNASVPLSTIIRSWPWQDTFLGGGVITSILVVLYYMAYLVFCMPESMALFREAMEPVFDFLNFWLVSAGLTAIGKRATTKPEVIDAEARVGTGAG